MELKEIIEQNAQAVRDFKAQISDIGENVDGLSARMKDIEQHVVGGFSGTRPAQRGLGHKIVESKGWQDFAAGQTKHAKVTLDVPLFEAKNTITGDSGSPAEPSDTLSPATRMPGLVGGPQRAILLRDVIPTLPAGSNLIEFTRESAFTNNAAQQTAEGDVKAETDIGFELVEAPIRTTAHFIKISRQALSDNPAIGAYVEDRMRYGVGLAEQNGFITGDGSGSTFDGLLNNAQAFTPQTGETALDSINRAAEAVSVADFTADTVILHPADWFAIRRLKNTDEEYLLGIGGGVAPLWGLNVIATNSMTQGQLLVGDMQRAAMIWDRQMITLDIFEQDSDNVQRNLVTIRAENRSTITVARPAALRAGALTA